MNIPHIELQCKFTIYPNYTFLCNSECATYKNPNMHNRDGVQVDAAYLIFCHLRLNDTSSSTCVITAVILAYQVTGDNGSNHSICTIDKKSTHEQENWKNKLIRSNLTSKLRVINIFFALRKVYAWGLISCLPGPQCTLTPMASP